MYVLHGDIGDVHLVPNTSIVKSDMLGKRSCFWDRSVINRPHYALYDSLWEMK